jgi:thiol-disulfide isomerase/thioredoxin
VTKPRLLVFATLASAALLLLGVLYWMTASTVHAPPAALAPLKLAAAPQPAPAVAFTGPGGRIANLHDFKGRYVLLNLWAPWCGPCVKELPALAALQRALPADRFVVVPVDVGREGQADAQGFLAGHGAGALQTYVDSNAALLRAFGGYGLPMTALIDPEGREIAHAEGAPEWGKPESVAYLRQLVAK